jgi:predicted nucleic acid-binding protein
MASSKIPYVYIDANIILDAIRGRNNASIGLMEKIREKKIKACTSGFTLLELLDKEQEYSFVWRMLKDGYTFDAILRKRDDRDLDDKELDGCFKKMDRTFSIPYKRYIDFYYLDNNGWDKSVELMHKYNLRSNDAIHLATAIMASCDLLVSNDQNLLRSASNIIKVATPENSNEMLESLKQ